MTSERPNPSDDETFFTMMEAEWGNQTPSLRDSMDAGVRRLFAKFREREKLLAEQADTYEELVEQMNGLWDELVGVEARGRITGKLRPTEVALDNDIAGMADNKLFDGLGPLEHDVDGAFCRAAGFGIVTQHLDFDEDGKVYLQLGIDDDSEDMDDWFRIRLEDIELLVLDELTLEGTEELLQRWYPELYDQLLELPRDCKDEREILRALQEMTLTFNPSLVDHLATPKVLLKGIEEFITWRLRFDHSTYTIGVAGDIESLDQKRKPVSQLYQGTLAHAEVDGVRLIPTDKVSTGDQHEFTFLPQIIARCFTPRRHTGRATFYITATSVESLRNERPTPDSFPFAAALTMKPAFKEEETIVEPVIVDTDNHAVPELLAPEGHDNESNETPPKEELELAELSEEVLTEYYHQIQGMLDAIRDICLVTYDTEDAMLAAVTQVGEIVAHLDRDIPREELLLEFSGAGLFVGRVDTEVHHDPEQQELSIETKFFDSKTGDSLAVKQGRIQGVNVVHTEAEGGFQLRAYLMMSDNEESLMLPVNELYDFVVSSRFAVSLTEGYHMAMPELERRQRENQVAMRLARIEDSALRGSLAALHEQLLHEDRETYVDLDEAVISELGTALQTIDPERYELDELLMDIFGKRFLRLSAEGYDASGKKHTVGALRGLLLMVVNQRPNDTKHELTLVIDDGEEINYVPFSTVKEVQF